MKDTFPVIQKKSIGIRGILFNRDLLPKLDNAIDNSKKLTTNAESNTQKTNTLIWKIIEDNKTKKSCFKGQRQTGEEHVPYCIHPIHFLLFQHPIASIPRMKILNTDLARTSLSESSP